MTDMGGTVILPKIVHALRGEAPNVRVVPVALGPNEVNDMTEGAAVDLAWGYFGHLNPALYQQTLFRRPLIGIRRKASGRRAALGFDAFVRTPHVFATATMVTNELLLQKVKRTWRHTASCDGMPIYSGRSCHCGRVGLHCHRSRRACRTVLRLAELRRSRYLCGP